MAMRPNVFVSLVLAGGPVGHAAEQSLPALLSTAIRDTCHFSQLSMLATSKRIVGTGGSPSMFERPVPEIRPARVRTVSEHRI